MLRVCECQYDQDVFRKSPEWSLATLSEPERSALRILQCTPDRHELDACRALERRWRLAYPELITRLAHPGCSPVVSIDGPFQDTELIHAMGIVCGRSDGTIYHVPVVEDVAGSNGYLHSWFSFIATRNKLVELLGDDTFNPEFNAPCCAIVPEKAAMNLLRHKMFDHGLRWYVQNSRALVLPTSHFEGCHILTTATNLEHCLRSLNKTLEDTEEQVHGDPDLSAC